MMSSDADLSLVFFHHPVQSTQQEGIDRDQQHRHDDSRVAVRCAV